MNNSIYTIEVYKHQGMWVFDDDRVGLIKEPFVAGADTLIDKLYLEISKGDESFMIVPRVTLIFSDKRFPTAKLVLHKNNVEIPESGTNYFTMIPFTAHTDKLHDLWLCPALNLYYPISPEQIYVDYK